MRQKDLARAAGISISYLSLLERNERDPSFSTVQRIAAALGVPVNILVFLAAEPHELSGLDQSLVEKMSFIVLTLLDASEPQQTLL